MCDARSRPDSKMIRVFPIESCATQVEGSCNFTLRSSSTSDRANHDRGSDGIPSMDPIRRTNRVRHIALVASNRAKSDLESHFHVHLSLSMSISNSGKITWAQWSTVSSRNHHRSLVRVRVASPRRICKAVCLCRGCWLVVLQRAHICIRRSTPPSTWPPKQTEPRR